MALIAHWPLNGDTRNSIGTIQVAGSITYSDEGKIGKCMDSGSLTLPSGTMNNRSQSIAFWYYNKAVSSATATTSQFMGGSSPRDYSLFTYPNNDDLHWDFRNLNNSTIFSGVLSGVLKNLEWTHITIINDNLHFKIYINGVLEQSKIVVSWDNDVSEKSFPLLINNPEGRYNDLRLYDHALTDAEIQEIHRTKILHYDFNDPNIEPTINLFSHREPRIDPTYAKYTYTTNGTWLDKHPNAIRVYSKETNGEITGFVNGGVNDPTNSYHAVWEYDDYLKKPVVVQNDVDGSWKAYSFGIGKSMNSLGLSVGDYYTISWDQWVNDLGKETWGFLHGQNGSGVNGFHDSIVKSRLRNTSTETWQRMYATFQVSSNWNLSANLTLYLYGYNKRGVIKMANVQMEAKDHPTPFTEYIREPGIISDISGYGFDGIQHGTPLIWSKDSPVSSGSAYFNTSTLITDKIFHDDINQEWTLSAWVKLDPVTVGNQQLNNFNMGNRIIHSAGNRRGLLYANSGTNDHYVYTESNGIPENEWFHLTYVYNKNGLVCDAYFNGELNASSTNFTSSDVPSGFAAETIFGTNLKGHMNDIRLYATELSAKDIKDLYETRAEISNSGTLQTYDFKQRRNLLQSVNQAIKDKQFKDGLSSYTQGNTNVTLTDRGYRIYRTPNVNPTDNGNTMWGGLRINMAEIPGGIPLTKGRSYRLIINANGKTANPSSGSSKFTNSMGWGGGGLNPTPITIGREWVQIPSNFNGKHDIIWEFKIEDDIYKVCTSSYSSFVAGNTYPSYNHLQLGWGYQNTGSEGTEIYITGIHLYDITDDDSIGISNKGIGTFDEYSTVGITDGLVGYWPLDKDLRDFSGNNYTAINYGGIFGSESIYFNGSSYITLPYGGNINPSINPQSFSMMVKKTASTDTIFFTTSQSGNSNARMYIRSGTNDGLNLAIQANSTNGNEYANSLSLNNWHYIVVTMDGSNAKLYLNGSLLNTKTYTPYLFNQNIRVGQHDGSYSFTGNIKNIKIFNRALTAEEIAIEYNTMFNNEVQIHESGVLYAKDLKQY